MQGPSCEVGQDDAKNNLKKRGSLSLGRHLDTGVLLSAKNGDPRWQLYPRQGREKRQRLALNGNRGGGGQPWTRKADVDRGPWKTMLLAGTHKKGCTSGDAHLQGAGVTWPGRMKRRQQHHSGLWCSVFIRVLNAVGGWTAGH